MRARRRRSGPRDFDPVRLGESESAAWSAYYRRAWRPFLASSLGLVSAGFGTGPVRTVRGAWWVLRANQVWAPYPDNDPDRARALMERFYAMVARDAGIDAREAARREVEWWRVHRVHQREDGVTEDDLVHAVADLYAYVYGAVRAGIDERDARNGHGPTAAQWWETHEPYLDQVLDPNQFPELSRLLTAARQSSWEPSAGFEFGLSRLIDGLEAYAGR